MPTTKPCQEIELQGEKRWRCPTLQLGKLFVEVLHSEPLAPRAHLAGLLATLEPRWRPRVTTPPS